MKFLKLDDGLAADGQQALGHVVGEGAHALALAGNGQNDLHGVRSRLSSMPNLDKIAGEMLCGLLRGLGCLWRGAGCVGRDRRR